MTREATTRDLAKSAVGLAMEINERLRAIEGWVHALDGRLHALESDHQTTMVRMGELQRDLDLLKGKQSE